MCASVGRTLRWGKGVDQEEVGGWGEFVLGCIAIVGGWAGQRAGGAGGWLLHAKQHWPGCEQDSNPKHTQVRRTTHNATSSLQELVAYRFSAVNSRHQDLVARFRPIDSTPVGVQAGTGIGDSGRGTCHRLPAQPPG